jgi:DNA-binding MarR family transcriptional regulator
MALTARADFAVLAALDEYGELSQATLGRHLGLDRNNVNGIVDRLNTADHVERRADPLDRRRNILTLTELGRWRLAELQGYADQVQEELLAALTDEERVSLSALLAKVLDSQGTQSA